MFKLDQVSPFNGIEHFAHDALGDVKATIEIAKGWQKITRDMESLSDLL